MRALARADDYHELTHCGLRYRHGLWINGGGGNLCPHALRAPAGPWTPTFLEMLGIRRLLESSTVKGRMTLWQSYGGPDSRQEMRHGGGQHRSRR